VRVDGLTPKTTYYYTVDSVNARSASDGVTSPVKTFTTEQRRTLASCQMKLTLLDIQRNLEYAPVPIPFTTVGFYFFVYISYAF
jgi:hypothetical protein